MFWRTARRTDRELFMNRVRQTGSGDFTTLYIYRNISMRTVSQISFALTGLAVRTNHLFYRLRTVFRAPYVIWPWYESRARPVSSSDLVLARLRAYDLRVR